MKRKYREIINEMSVNEIVRLITDSVILLVIFPENEKYYCDLPFLYLVIFFIDFLKAFFQEYRRM